MQFLPRHYDALIVQEGDADLRIQPPLSYSAWVRVPFGQRVRNEYFVTNTDTSRSHSGINMYLFENAPCIGVGDGDNGTGGNIAAYVSQTELNEGDWNYIAFTMDTAIVDATGEYEVGLFLNGRAIPFDNVTAGSNRDLRYSSGSFYLGKKWDLFFTGELDDVRIYDRALRATEIDSIASGLSGFVDPQVGRISVYPSVASSVITIDADQQISSLDVVDTQGRSISIPRVAGNTYDISTLVAGLYYVNVITSDQRRSLASFTVAR